MRSSPSASDSALEESVLPSALRYVSDVASVSLPFTVTTSQCLVAGRTPSLKQGTSQPLLSVPVSACSAMPVVGQEVLCVDSSLPASGPIYRQ